MRVGTGEKRQLTRRHTAVAGREVAVTTRAKKGRQLSPASDSSRTYFLLQRRLTLIKVLECRHVPEAGRVGQIWDTISRVCVTPDMQLIIVCSQNAWTCQDGVPCRLSHPSCFYSCRGPFCSLAFPSRLRAKSEVYRRAALRDKLACELPVTSRPI